MINIVSAIMSALGSFVFGKVYKFLRIKSLDNEVRDVQKSFKEEAIRINTVHDEIKYEVEKEVSDVEKIKKAFKDSNSL